MTDKYFLYDDRLTWKAKGIFMGMVTSDKSIFSINDFITDTDKRKSIKSGLEELLELGYIKKENSLYLVVREVK